MKRSFSKLLPLVSCLLFFGTCCVTDSMFINKEQVQAPLFVNPIPGIHRNVAFIDLTGVIDPVKAVQFTHYFQEIYGSPKLPDVILIKIDSPGGIVESASEMATEIMASPIPVVCVADGLVASAAYYILELCPLRVIAPGTRLMVHEAKIEDPKGDAEQMEKYRQMEEFTNMAMAEVNCGRMNISIIECRERYRKKEWWMNVNEALSVGAVDAWAPSTGFVLDSIRGSI